MQTPNTKEGKAKSLVDLNPTYSAMSWEVLGQEPQPPNFAESNIKIESRSSVVSQSFIQGLYVEPEGDRNKVLFDPDPPREKPKSLDGSDVAPLDTVNKISEITQVIGLNEEEVSRIVAEAEQAAYERGLNEGKEAIDAKIEGLSTRWEEIISDMTLQMAQSRKQLEHDMITFCSDVVRYFLRGAIPGDEEVLSRIITEALNHIDRNTACDVLVNEIDFAIIEESPKIQAILGKYGVQVSVENNVKSGCVLQTENETFNFDVLDAYERAVRELHGEKK